MLGLIIYISWLIAIGFLARHKGRGSGRWIFFGLFLCLPATIFLLVLPRVYGRTCLYCREGMKADANVCPHCGRPQYIEAVAQGPYGRYLPPAPPDEWR